MSRLSEFRRSGAGQSEPGGLFRGPLPTVHRHPLRPRGTDGQTLHASRPASEAARSGRFFIFPGDSGTLFAKAETGVFHLMLFYHEKIIAYVRLRSGRARRLRRTREDRVRQTAEIVAGVHPEKLPARGGERHRNGPRGVVGQVHRLFQQRLPRIVRRRQGRLARFPRPSFPSESRPTSPTTIPRAWSIGSRP